MATQFEIECALMAGASYYDTRDEINRFPIPDGWNRISRFPVALSNGSGFEASAFGNGVDITHSTEIVISFAGTYDKDITGDIAADIALAKGEWSDQLLQAAEYYLQVKAANPDAEITLTGHSLGGGLAALIGVFFGEKAITFDQAPFANSASIIVATDLKNDLMLAGYGENDLVGLTSFLQQQEAEGGIPNSALISNIRVAGEFLSNIWPASSYDTIGQESATVIEHGYMGNLLSGLDLHSMSLLTAFLQNNEFSQVTKSLPGLLDMLFDDKLYAYPTDTSNTTKVNFLEYLIHNQEGPDPTVPNDSNKMLDRFTADMQRVSQTVGWSDEKLSKALIAFAMQMYYENPDATNTDKELFSNVTGGIRFNRNDVAGDLFNDAKGFYLYFRDYLSENFSNDERALIYEQLPDLVDWYVPAGGQAMSATAGTERAFMMGGSFFDVMTGSSQADVLLGYDGEDHLYGGADDDTLIGGEGIDYYYIQGNDTIVDSGLNFVYFKDESQEDQLLAGGFVQEAGATNVYRSISNDQITLTFHSPGHLVINDTDSVTFANQTSVSGLESDTNADNSWRMAA